MKRVFASGFVASGLLLAYGPAAAAPKVVTSIKPVHSLVAGVMTGVGTPQLLVKGGGSPHSYSLRPSEARALNAADVIFWIGEDLETFLEKPIGALAGNTRVVELAASPGMELLKTREGGVWEGHDEDHSEHEEHAGHDEHEAQEEHDEHEEHAGHGEHKAQEEHDEHEEHAGHGEHNMHIWLDPHNAQRIVRTVIAELSRIDQDNAGRYAANGETLIERLDRLDREVAATLAPVKDLPYVVFHDAYHYFERRFGTNAVGSISVSPDRAPGARRLTEVRRKIARTRAACVFSEPQFTPALVDTVIEGTEAKTAVLDPLGAELDPGPEAYFQIMRGLAGSLRDCLTPAS